MTSDTSGQLFENLSKSANLQRSLENRLPETRVSCGCREYRLSFRNSATCANGSSGRVVASVPRSWDRESTGWPRPTAQEMRTKSAERLRQRRESCRKKHSNGNGFGLTLGNAVTLFLDTTGHEGELNPQHLCWLMGFPSEWTRYAPTAMRSSRKSRQSS